MTGTGRGAGRSKCVAAVTEAERCQRQVGAANALVEIVTRFWSLRTIAWHLGRDGTLAGRTGDGLSAAEASAVFGAWAAVLDLRPAIAAGPPGRPAIHRAADGRWAGVMVSLTANCSGRPRVAGTHPAPWRRPGGAVRAAQALARIVTVGEQAGAAIGWCLRPAGDLTGTVHVPGSARRIRQVFRGWEQCLGLGVYEERAVGDEIACRATARGAVDGVPVRLVATLWPDWPPSRSSRPIAGTLPGRRAEPASPAGASPRVRSLGPRPAAVTGAAAVRGAGPGAEWRNRYAGRTRTQREDDARRWVVGGTVTWDPAGPYQGCDGALYHPGGIEDTVPPIPVLLITSRGMTEVVSGWDSWPEMLGWMASRGTTGSGELQVPSAARRARCVQEEAVLGYALSHPTAILAIASYLPAETFTSDIRYDLWAAMGDLARSGRGADRERVADALAERAAMIPARQLHWYGGRRLPWALALLWRLEWTLGTRETARAAAAALRAEDRQAGARQGALAASTRRGVLAGPRRAVRGHASARPALVAAPVAIRPALPRPPVLPDGTVQ